MNDNPEVPNPLLRAAATSTAFHLTFSKYQVRVLDAIAHGVRGNPSERWERLWVPTAHNLINRGLLAHRCKPNWIGKDTGTMTESINNYYRLTKAGWMVHGLLAEAGLVENTSAKQRRLVA